MDTITQVGHRNAALATVGAVANRYAAMNVFEDYKQRRAVNTVESQLVDLNLFAQYLTDATGDDYTGESFHCEPMAWQGITWGLVDGFVRWMIGDGRAIASINRALSSVRTYAGLAAKAGTLTPDEMTMIRTVKSISLGEAVRIDDRREVTRIGTKPAESAEITDAQARQLKIVRDGCAECRQTTGLLCFFIDHGLRVGEIVRLRIENLDMETGVLRFRRPKVSKMQNIRLSADAMNALALLADHGELPNEGPIFPVSERTVQRRIKGVSDEVGVDLTTHAFRHWWATYWVQHVPLTDVMDAGGWTSLATVRKYVARKHISNETMLPEATHG